MYALEDAGAGGWNQFEVNEVRLRGALAALASSKWLFASTPTGCRAWPAHTEKRASTHCPAPCSRAQAKFNVRTTYQEEIYTTRLDRNQCGISEAEAARIASEIERGVSSNPHMMEERGRAIGVNDSFAGGITVFAALVTGPLIDIYGLPATGLTAVVLALVPFGLRLFSGPMK